MPPTIAWARPIRPPRCRYSSVSTENTTWSRSRAAWNHVTSSFSGRPRTSLRCSASASTSVPSDADPVSSTVIRRPPGSTARAAISAVWELAERRLDTGSTSTRR